MTIERFDETDDLASASPLAVPLIAEELIVGKRAFDAGGVRLHKRVHADTVTVEQALQREQVEVERVPMNTPLAERVEARFEGDTMIIPVIEERLVTRVELVLVEEIRVTRRTVTHRDVRQVALRREELDVERFEPEDGPVASDAPVHTVDGTAT